jgi:mannose-6-phosphate isomerase
MEFEIFYLVLYEIRHKMLEIGDRPWGKYYVLEDEPHYKLKRIEVNPGQRLSYQYHHHRQEFWTIVEGEAVVVLDEVEHIVKYGESIFIPLGAKHRIENRSSELLVFVEVQTGTYFGEDDIVRIQDDYAR